ncbi:MAG TPA: hypothetical protein VLX11_04410, partial [Candidatus Acidoferrales bacterium]|nr:hypothetical protein [Candidatus Acidoferrales bacterium]
MPVVNDVLALDEYDFPKVRSIGHAPVFAAHGRLIVRPGYDPAAEIHYVESGLQIARINDRPTADDVESAKGFIEELLFDFPFADEPSRAHAYAALLQPFARLIIAAPTPLYLFDSPKQGTGKGLLASVICIVATGQDAARIPPVENEQEMRKQITSVLLEGRQVILIDNVRKALDSPSLAVALTSFTWSDRVLGVSKM